MLTHCDRRSDNEDRAVPPEGWYQYGCYMPLALELVDGSRAVVDLFRLDARFVHDRKQQAGMAGDGVISTRNASSFSVPAF